METLIGDIISIRPMTAAEKDLFYEWATNSEGSGWWYGEHCGEEIPSRGKFFSDFKAYYFDGSSPMKGRSFMILENKDGRQIGQINYQHEEEAEHKAEYELDIIIASASDTGKGYGSQALKLMTGYLNTELGIKRFVLHTLPYNERAIRSFEKAGFRIEKEVLHDGVLWSRLILEIP